MPAMHVGEGGGGDDDGGGGDSRNALLLAIQKGKSLKKVANPDDAGATKARRATIANPADAGGGGDLMAALKERMNLRRKGISGARKEEEGGGQATGDAPRPPTKSMTMPTLLPSQQEPADSPISMKGMASALKAAASNRKDDDDGDDGDWSD